MKKQTSWLATVAAVLMLGGCSGMAPEPADGGPAAPVDVSHIPDAVPKAEPRSRYGNPASYVVYGRRYHVRDSAYGYHERGTASWYGTKFHGRRTSSGEPYDMYAMTAAHKTLPLPTYVEVTNLDNGRRVIVKVNDRGPFHDGRIIDLSYTAARKLGIAGAGTGRVELRAIIPDPAPTPTVRQAASEPAAPRVTAAPTTASALPEAAPLPAAGDEEEAIVFAHVADAETAASSTATASPAPDRPQPQAAGDGDGDAEASQPVASTAPGFYLQVGAFADRDNAERLRTRLTPATEPLPVTIERAPSLEATLYRVRVGPVPSVEEADRLAGRLNDAGLGNPRLVLD